MKSGNCFYIRIVLFQLRLIVMSTHKDRENVKVVCDRLAKLKEKMGNRDKKRRKMRNASGQQGENE